jgi:hypothetical protein
MAVRLSALHIGRGLLPRNISLLLVLIGSSLNPPSQLHLIGEAFLYIDNYYSAAVNVWGHAIALMIEELWDKPEGRGFETR